MLSSVKVILSNSKGSDYPDGLTPHPAFFAIGNFLKTGLYLHSAEYLNLEGKCIVINPLTMNYGNSVSGLTSFSQFCPISKLSFYPVNIFHFKLQTNPPKQYCN